MKRPFTRLLSKFNFRVMALLLVTVAGFSNYAIAQAPANDECTGAVAFPTIPTDQTCVSVVANTNGATQSLPDCIGTADDDVWYSFVCPAGYTSLRYSNTDVSGSSDRVIEFYSGTCGNLTSLGCNDNENGSITGLTPGNTYYFRIYTYSSTGTTQVSVCLQVPPPPANDECAGAIAFPTIPTDQSCVSVVANTNGATQSLPDCTGAADDDVWYSFVCPAGYTSLRYSNTDVSGSSDRVIEFYSGTCGALTSLGCNDNENGSVAGLTPGNTYYFRIYTYSDDDTTQVSVCLSVPPPPPVNDECATAIAFPAIPTDGTCASITANTESATPSLPGCTGVADDDVWYSFVCPTGYTSLVYTNTDVSGSSDRVIQFFSGTCGTLTSLQCYDDEAGVISGLTPGSTYYFRVYTYDTAEATQVSVCLKVLPNDECTTAIAFPTIPTDGTCASVTASTDGATQSLAGCTGTADDDVWYSFVCPIGYDSLLYKNTDVSGNTDRVIEFFSGTCGNLASIGCNDSEEGSIAGLTAGSTYYFRIYTYGDNNATEVSVCLSVPPPPPSNDEATGAIALTLGAGCTGAPYTNLGGTQSTGEPFPNVRGTEGNGTTWFKFTAPASGMVKITNDYSDGTAGEDTKLGLFSATDSSDYSTFTALAGDDDNGVVISSRSTIFAAGLTSGTTYYIAYDGYSSSTDQGTFCLTVDEMNSTMLAATGTCTNGQGAYSDNAFTGWRSLVTSDGTLIANVKQNPGINGSGVTAAITINTSGTRTNTTGIPYLDRNYSFVSDLDTTADVQLFFSAADFAALNGAIVGGGGSAISLSDLNVTHQEGSCQANFDQTNGTNSLLTQTANGTTNGVDFIQVSTPGFSNFYIMAGTVPLPLKLISFTGQNNGTVNTLNWQTAEEKNFSHFELQRSSNGADFAKLDIIAGKNLSTGSKYQYNDANPLEGRNFYRLVMVDLNGKSIISNVVELTAAKGSGISFTVHPNPVKAVMQMNVAGKIDGNANILIMDVMGKVLKTIHPVANTLSVDMSAMPSGTYIVKYIDNSHSVVTKVIKD